MNIQDIADFIDLVKNPAKYERVLQNLKEEQGRLTAVIETVGKVSEIDSILKQTQTKEARLEANYTTKLAAIEKQSVEDAATYSKLKATVRAELEQLNKQAEELANKNKEQVKLAADLTKREKALVGKETTLASTQEGLNVLVKEYEDKVNKLRAVMA